jgi:AraC-like DNA-binding protein
MLWVDNYREILPAARLVRYVECYWFRDDLHGTPHHRVLPDGCVDILFSTQNGEPTSLAIVGLMTTPQIVNVRAGQSFFGVRFRPGMAAAFLPAAAQLNDRIEPLENVLGSAARHLFDQLAGASSPLAMARLMDTVLRPLKPPDTAQNALQELLMDAGTIEQVATAAALSTRQLRRLCMERVGVSPKYLRRILRFRKAARRIAELGTDSSRPNWADFAALSGYYDQAHFIREFQKFAGHTPGRYLQSLPTPSPYNRNHEPSTTREPDRLR